MVNPYHGTFGAPIEGERLLSPCESALAVGCDPKGCLMSDRKASWRPFEGVLGSFADAVRAIQRQYPSACLFSAADDLAIRYQLQRRATLSEGTVVEAAVPRHAANILMHPRMPVLRGAAAAELVPVESRLERLGSQAPALQNPPSMASSAAIQQQLDRILQSPPFLPSARLSRFLRFIVEHAIGGSQSSIKEYVIGAEVYDRKPPYHPSQDSIVRTEARRLRGKLKEYYGVYGARDPLFIRLCPGSYVPVFQCNTAACCIDDAQAGHSFVGSAPDVHTIAILPFRDISRTILSSTIARGIPDELAYTLQGRKICRVISPASTAHFGATEDNLCAAMRRVNATLAYEGSVREEDQHLRVTAGIINAAGVQIWAQRIDADARSQALFTLEKYFASVLAIGTDLLAAGRPVQH